MIRGIHYFSTELKTKIDVIPRSCFKVLALKYLYPFKYYPMAKKTRSMPITQLPFTNRHVSMFQYMIADRPTYIVINIFLRGYKEATCTCI